MKFFPLLGALLISAAPVQAFETVEELIGACYASEEIDGICLGVAEISGAAAMVSLLCDLEEKGRLTKENVVLSWDELVKRDGWTPLSYEAVELILKDYSECSIKPIP